MINRLFHKPKFHLEHAIVEKKASWLELFYDLIYVASFIQLGNAFASNISLEYFLKTFIVFLSLWVSWSGFTYYSNRYTVDDFLHRILIFIHMFFIGAMTVTVPGIFKDNYQSFTFIYGLSQFVIAILYLRTYIQQELGRDYTAFWGKIFFASGVVWLLSCFLHHDQFFYGWLAGSMVVLGSSLFERARNLVEKYPFDHEHLSERYGLLTIIVLGESFVKVMSELAGQETGVSIIFQSSFTLLLTCSVWWIYFDDVALTHLKKLKFAMPVWLVGHLPLQLAIVTLGIGIKKAITFQLDQTLPFKYAILLTGSLSTILIFTAIIDTVTLRKNSELRDDIRVNIRLFSGILVILIGLVSQSFTNFWLLSACLFIALFQIVFDTFFAPYEINEEELEHTAKLLAKAKKEEIKPIAKDLNQAPIRKGLQSSLKKDLYFYFIESSWPILFITLFFLYILSNAFFATLYLLTPSGIENANPESFLDAFFFSVQTMSTIGFGTLSPSGFYSNLIVTLEAAFGLISVAMVTGLIFAKIAKPNSKILFSKNAVRSPFDGQDCLSFRLGNARGNDILEAKMSISALIDEVTSEGEHVRRIYELKLKRKTSPSFTLSWSVFHPIDEDSPFYGKSLNDLEFKGIIATMTGHDGTFSNTIYSRHVYYLEDIVEGKYFKDIMHQLPDGRMMINYGDFHKFKE